MKSIALIATQRFARRASVAAATVVAFAAGASAQTALTPPAQRITDAAISADQQAYEGLQSRIKGLNDRGRPLRDHHLAKAQCWLDVSFHEYTRNDRSAFPQAALDESEKLIAAMERAATPLPMDTPLVNDAERLRPDLWAAAAALRTHAGWRCAQAKAACGEVELVHAGNEHKQQGWRHAKPYVQIAEDLLGEAQALADNCVPPPARVAAVVPVPVAVPVPPPEPVAAAPQPVSLGASVVFDFDRDAAANMRPAGVQQLDALLGKLRSDGLAVQSVRLVGHADRLRHAGQADYNQRLSERRAATVRDHLVARGVPAGLIRIEARGDSQQVEPCPVAKSPAKGKAGPLQDCLLPNRRVEVQITAGKP
jgi:outer membrane protein OmpA-like peptidoglycan-associated protein